jgi:hypothetical protein
MKNIAKTLTGALLLSSFVFAEAQTPVPAPAPAQPPAPAAKSDYPPVDTVTAGYEKVVSNSDGSRSFYTIWRRNKDQQLLAELPKTFASQRHFIALTVASGESYAGLQAGERYVYWRQYGNRMALVEPNLQIRSNGDNESKSSVKRLFTDRVLVDVPILAIVPNGGPLIDLDALLIDNASVFFGSSARGLRKQLMTIKTAKAFPQNVEIGIELPGASGQLKTLHYSISLITPNPSYKPRAADERIGYFTTSYVDFGKFKEDETNVRFINRWHLEKADPSLKLSPPKEPIVFYIEHTTPIRYRQWVKKGIELWNDAFEKVGIIGAIQVLQQDAVTKAYMDLDPEDVRYNFVRWLNNGVGTAIGPSRVDPNTGQILDADIILTDGWIRHWWSQYYEVLPEVVTEGYSPETLTWLHQNPRWDPRVRLAPPFKRDEIVGLRARQGIPALGGHALGKVDGNLIGDQEYDGLMGRYSQKNGLCMAANCKSHGIGMMHMELAIAAAEMADFEKNKGGKKKKKDAEGELIGAGSGAIIGGTAGEEPATTAEVAKTDEEKKKEEEAKKKAAEAAKKPTINASGEQLLDGIPETFIGPLIIDLVAHEVGHTIGLRHNFKGSSLYTMEQINSEEFKGKKPFGGSVMDYIPININLESGKVQGDWGMLTVGPYDEWAIEYGYTFATDLKPILSRVAEPELAFATDEDTWDSDPYARRYDFAKDTIVFAQEQMNLVNKHRTHLLEKYVKDGQSWSKARRGYLLTLSTQTRAVSMMANWVGGAHVYRDRKGDPNGRKPIEVVSADKQREALDFVIANTFNEETYGLSPDLLAHLTIDKWWDDNSSSMFDVPAWPVHDQILSIQASILTGLMNPSTLELVYDNEFRTPSDQDAFTLPELLSKLKESIWGDVAKGLAADAEKYTPRKPMISSLDRNLQKEYVERLMDLIRPDSGFSASAKPISNLAAFQLGEIRRDIEKLVKASAGKLDPYTRAHLAETSKQIKKALDANYVIDVGGGGGGGLMFLIGKEAEKGE